MVVPSFEDDEPGALAFACAIWGVLGSAARLMYVELAIDRDER